MMFGVWRPALLRYYTPPRMDWYRRARKFGLIAFYGAQPRPAYPPPSLAWGDHTPSKWGVWGKARCNFLEIIMGEDWYTVETREGNQRVLGDCMGVQGTMGGLMGPPLQYHRGIMKVAWSCRKPRRLQGTKGCTMGYHGGAMAVAWG